jgi:hypothetical protein
MLSAITEWLLWWEMECCWEHATGRWRQKKAGREFPTLARLNPDAFFFRRF